MSRSGNHDVDQAIRNFQSFAGLKVTGRLDRATIRQMKKPRCGMPDKEVGGDRFRRYATSGKWRKKHLTYFVQHGQDLSASQQDRIFAKALQYWADVSGLSFSRANSARSADLKIRYLTLYRYARNLTLNELRFRLSLLVFWDGERGWIPPLPPSHVNS